MALHYSLNWVGENDDGLQVAIIIPAEFD